MNSGDGNQCAARVLLALATWTAVVLAGCAAPSTDPSSVDPSASAASAPALSLASSVVTQGIPPIPLSLVKETAAYTDFRGHRFVAWHPTQREMLVSWRASGANTVQLYRLAGPMSEPEALTSGDDPVTVATYEPTKGQYVVFERSVGGDEASQLFRFDLADRSTTRLTEPGQRHDMQRWLHRSSRLLVNSTLLDASTAAARRAPLAQTLSLIDPMKPSERRKLAELPGSGWEVGAVSWDDRTLALNRALSGTDSQVWLMTLATGRMTQILPAPNPAAKSPEPASAWRAASFSRDNASLWITTDQAGEFKDLQRYTLATRRRTPITRAGASDIDQVTQSSDGRLLAVKVTANGRGDMRLIDGRTLKEMTAQTLPDGSIDEVHFHRKLPELELSVSSAQGPRQIFSFNTTVHELEQWTRASSPPGVDASRFGEQSEVRWKSFDDKSISGLMNTPPARFTGKRPVMILIHDGPEAQATAGFIDRYNYAVNELGVALIQPNVRGSSGFGKSFLKLDDGRKRDDAVRDIGALLDWIATQPGLDASRVVISGEGYGGYLSLTSSARYADRIVGTIDVGGMSSFTTFLEHAESTRRDRLRLEYGDERDATTREFLESISPLTNADRLTKPVLIVAGRNDARVPYTESEQLAAKLRERSAPVWYLRADNDGHGFNRQDNADFQFYATILFIRQILK